MKTIHPAIAEHVMEENARLRGLLMSVLKTPRGSSGRIILEPDEEAAIRAALSQQAEPAPAQDQRDSVIAHIELCITNLKAEHQTNPRVIAEVLYNIGYSRATRPVQTEQQPLFVPEGWLIELGFDVLDRPFRFVDSQSHSPTIKVILPPCEPDDSSSWDLRDEIARRIGSVLADPIAQASPQPEQSGWISVEDRLPDGHKAEYLCLFGDGHQQVSEWLHDEIQGWVFWYGDPTHWMPLPAAPGLSAQGTSK